MRTVYKSTAYCPDMQTQRRTFPNWERKIYRGLPRVKGGGPSRPHFGEKRASGPTFTAGETVKETGIYEVVHDGGHREAHEVVMLSGDAFPACDTCEQRVHFRLVRTAPYIFQDEDFEEPAG
jgi:hypothetical protein